MGNILRVLKRDLIRLVKAPSAMIVMLALLILPSAYTWYNVAAFWDPYGNTASMHVCVVNEDAGGSSDLTGELNVGDSIVEKLEENNQFDWSFSTRDEALADLEAGRVYAVFIVPEDFTEDILALTNGEIKSPAVQYYVNEKIGPVSPKITDTGSTTLEEIINESFVDTATAAVVDTVTSAATDLGESSDEKKSVALLRVDSAIESIDDVVAGLDKLDSRLASLQSKRATASAAIDKVATAVDSASGKIDGLSSKAYEVEEKLIEAAPKASEAAGESLEKLALLEIPATIFGYEEEVSSALSSLQEGYSLLFTEALPSTASGVGKIGSAMASLSASLDSQKTLFSQAQSLLNNIDALASQTRTAIKETKALIVNARTDLDTVRTDLETISISTEINDLLEEYNIDSSTIASFVSAPTSIRTEQLYPTGSFGAAMAPLFMNLTFWIGAFMFLVVFRQEVDDEGVKNLTITQRHISRFLYFAIPAMLQSVVCCTGLFWLGVSVTNVPALYLAAAVSSLAYISLIYTLSTVLQHIGKGLCIVLVFLQIPAATGLYPIEMTADFYQAISPLFPFTYGIGALREAISGFYGYEYVRCLLVLAAFFFGFLIVGIVLRPLLSNLNRMVAREIGETGLMNGEHVEAPERKYRINQMLLALTDRAGYKDELRLRYGRFLSLYPTLMKAAIAFGVIVPIATGLICMVAGAERVVTLTIWLVWLLVVFALVIALETFRHGFRNQFALNDMSEEELLEVFRSRGSMHETETHEKSKRRAFAIWELSEMERNSRAEIDPAAGDSEREASDGE